MASKLNPIDDGSVFADRAIIVTGGASGIGEATCRLIARQGGRVIISDIQDRAGRKLAEETGGLFLRHDVRDEAGWRTMLDEAKTRFGRIHGLVACAGVKSNSAFDMAPDIEGFDQTVAVNQRGVLLGLQIVGRYMREAGGGAIVNVASATGMPPAISQDIAYVGTKWAVRGISRTAARQLAPFGVRVNTVLPGLVRTPMIAGSMDADPEQVARAEASIPMRRIAEPVEIARAVCFLLSDLASYATGSELTVDGGLVA